MADFTFRPETPSAHLPIVYLCPFLRPRLNGVFSCHTENATRSSTPSGLLVLIECNQMKMRVVDVVSGLVVDRQNVARLSLRQCVRKRASDFQTLRRRCFDRKRHDEPFASTALAFESFLFGSLSLLVVGRLIQSLTHDATRCGRAGNVSQVRSRLPRLCNTVRSLAFWREGLHRVSKRKECHTVPFLELG
jgi:hypothetical protein